MRTINSRISALTGGRPGERRPVPSYCWAINMRCHARRVRFTNDQRRRLAAKARTLGRRLLREIATIVTPDTLPGC